jgi:4-amino-4-deoxy-L-arabinose transferase-like glycosyltransferase
MLALCALLSGLDISSAAMLLQGLLFFGYVWLLFRIGRQCSFSPLLSVLLVLVCCLLPGMFNFSRQMSEGLFNTLLLALLSVGLDTAKKPRPLLLGVLAGLLFLTRYAGMAFMAGSAAFLVLVAVPDWKRMLRMLFLFGIGPATAMGGWMLLEQWMHAGHFNRRPIFHAIPPHQWMSLSEQVNTQLFPPLQWIWPFSGLLMLGLFLLFGGWWMIRFRQKTAAQQFGFIWLCLCAFLALLLITCFFLDAHTPLDARIWSPAAPLLLLLLFLMLHQVPPLLRLGLPLFLLLWNLIPSATRWNNFRKNGEGLGARTWRTSPTLRAAAAAVQSGKAVYSNGADVLNYYWNPAGRFRIHPMPLKFYPTSGIPNPGFERESKAMLAEVQQRKAVLVYFHEIRWRKYLEDSTGITRRMHGVSTTVCADGHIWAQP